MIGRLLLILIPLITLLIPPRWFGAYAVVVLTLALCAGVIFSIEHTSEQLIGPAALFGYIGANLALLTFRHHRIRRARERILKLPKPKE